MQADEAWDALGELLAAALESATAALTSRFTDQIRLRLQYFKTTKAQRDAVAQATRGPLDLDEVTLAYAGETRDLLVRRQLHGLWEHLTTEYADEPAEWRFAELDAQLREVLAAVHAEGDALIAALGDVGARTADRHAWSWPITAREDLGDVVATWREGASARMGVPLEALLDPASVRGIPVYRTNEVSTTLSNLAVWLEDRTAWARALHDLEPVLDAFVPDRERSR